MEGGTKREMREGAEEGTEGGTEGGTDGGTEGGEAKKKSPGNCRGFGKICFCYRFTSPVSSL